MATINGSKSDIRAYGKACKQLRILNANKLELAAKIRVSTDLFLDSAQMLYRWEFMELSVQYKNLINDIRSQENLVEYLSRHLKIEG